MGCGGTLYNTRGVVTSPNFPQAHAQLSNCQWTLKVPPGQKIELRFTRKKKKIGFSFALMRHTLHVTLHNVWKSWKSHIVHFWHFWMNFLMKCKLCSLRSQCFKMRLFLWFSTTVIMQCAISDTASILCKNRKIVFWLPSFLVPWEHWDLKSLFRRWIKSTNLRWKKITKRFGYCCM